MKILMLIPTFGFIFCSFNNFPRIDRHLCILNFEWELGYNTPYYSIGFRGKNHRMVLLRDGEPVCAGMIHITNYVMYVRGIKHWFEGVINEKTSDTH